VNNREKKPLYGKSFDVLLAVPLAVYLLLIAGLTLAVFFAITPAAVRQAFSDRAIWDAVSLSLITTTLSTFLSVLTGELLKKDCSFISRWESCWFNSLSAVLLPCG